MSAAPAPGGRDEALAGALRLLALALAAWAFWPITRVALHSDDFFNLYTLINWEFPRYALRMHGGHLLIARNLVTALAHAAFDTHAALYMWLALATHLVNVWLLFRVVERLGGGAFAAFVAAALWGMAPAHQGTLGWHAVYGQVMVATCALWVLDELARAADGEPPRRGAPLWWAAAMLIAGMSFGVGLGVAAAMPAAAWLLLPAGAPRRRAVAALALVPPLLALTYLAIQRGYADAYGTLPESMLVFSQLRDGMGPELHYFAVLARYGIGLIALGPAGHARLAGALPGTLAAAAVALLALAACWRGGGATRRRLAAALLLALAAYAPIAAGRGVFARPELLAQFAAVPRYHYAAGALLAVGLGVALAALAGQASRRAVGFAAATVSLLLLALHAVFAPPIALWPAAHREAQRVVTAIKEAIAAAPPGAPVVIDNAAFHSVGYLTMRDPQFPGWAALYCLYFPEARRPGRQVYFRDANAEIRAAARGGHCSDGLLLAPGDEPPAAAPAAPAAAGDLLGPAAGRFDAAARAALGAEARASRAWRAFASLPSLALSLVFVALLGLAGAALQRLGPGPGRALARLAAGAAALALFVWLVRHPSAEPLNLITRRDHLLFALLAGAAAVALAPRWRRWLFAALSAALLVAALGPTPLALGVGVPLLGVLALRASAAQPGWQIAALQAAVLVGGYAACWSLRAAAPLTALVAQGVLAFTALRHISFAVETRRGQPATLGHYLAYQLFYPNCLGATERYDQFAERNLTAAPPRLDYAGAVGRLVLGHCQVWLALQMTTTFEIALTSPSTPHLWLTIALTFVRSALFLMGVWHIIGAVALLYGFVLAPNFARILTRRTPAEFWHAWRGTMTQWLVRYVYIPLGGNRAHQSRNIFAAFGVSLAWHWAGQPFLGRHFTPLQLLPIFLWALLNASAVTAQLAARRHGWRLLPAALPAHWRTLLHIAGTLALGTFTVTLLGWEPRTIVVFDQFMLRLMGLR